jgi:uncharacterized protein (DUF885 family)
MKTGAMTTWQRTSWIAPFFLLIACVSSGAQAAASGNADNVFEKQFGDAFFAAFWAQRVDYGIAVGYYKYADRLTAPDAKARTAQLEFVKQWQTRLHAIDKQALSDSHRADWALLDNEFAWQAWELTQARSWEWDPSNYNVADSFARILSTEYAPLDQRLRTTLKRLANVPAYYAAAKQSIKNPTREHTQLAIEQNQGALAIFGDELNKQIVDSGLSEHERLLFTQRLAATQAAINDYVAWLQAMQQQFTPGNSRSFRLGKELYEQKFALNIQTGDTPQALYQRALQEKERLLARMTVLADQLWPKYFPNTAPPENRMDRIGRLIDKLSEQHVARAEFFAEIERQIPELAKWVTDHQLLTLDATKPLKVRVTPAYQRGIALAGIEAPGPYDANAATYFDVLPLEDLPPERAESLLREYNRWMLPILNIHEAIPGHYAQLMHANKSASRIKAIFGNGAMIEGWAVYGERMMLESGYGDSTAEMWLLYSKWSLRSICNTILDYSVHVLDMSEADAKQLLIRDAFQSQEEASGKWRRVQLTQVQLTSYFAGYSAIYELRERQKRELGAGFDLKRFHEQFLSYGNASVSAIRELMESPHRQEKAQSE